MSSYKELLAQREKLEQQIEEAKSREYAEVLNDQAEDGRLRHYAC
jgi:DNA-binding protein H-NS